MDHRINAAARLHGMSYSQFMGKIHANNIELNRKVLADLAMNHPDALKPCRQNQINSDYCTPLKNQPIGWFFCGLYFT